jgi:xanthine phosphoribosyltransferase
MLPKAHFATVYAKPLGAPLVDSVAVTVAQSEWLVFPWDQTY